jgi:hypothetical protein
MSSGPRFFIFPHWRGCSLNAAFYLGRLLDSSVSIAKRAFHSAGNGLNSVRRSDPWSLYVFSVCVDCSGSKRAVALPCEGPVVSSGSWNDPGNPARTQARQSRPACLAAVGSFPIGQGQRLAFGYCFNHIPLRCYVDGLLQ